MMPNIEDQHGSARYLYLPAAVAAIGGLLFGFDTAVINGAIVFLKNQFSLSDAQTEIAASSLLLGCVVGASVAAFTSDRFGRKRVLLAAAALFTVSSLGSALPRDLTQFVIARVIGGLAIGIASTLSPLYIAEISPAKSRGLMVSLNQLAIVIGILLSYSVNYLLTGAGPANWRWMFASAAVPSFCFLIALLFISESPRWLVQKGRERDAEHFLAQMVGSEAAREEIKAIRSAIAEESGNLLDPAFRKPLVVAIVIALFSQFTGINTIIYYGSLVFLEHVPHQTASTALWANVVIGAINFIATIVGMSLIDRAGRKPLLMSAFGGNGFVPDWCFRGHSFSGPGDRCADFCPHLRGLFCGRGGNRHLGHDVGNMPDANTGTGDVGGNHLSLVRNAAGDADFPVAGQGSSPRPELS